MLTALELRIPPPVLALLTAFVMWIGARDNAPFARPTWLTPLVAGIGVIAAGIMILAVIALRRAKTTISPIRPEGASALVETGIYSVTRNPIYLADALALLAYAFHLWQPQSFVAVPVFMAWIHRFQILPEERVLQAAFGVAYERYAAATRRWL